MRAISLSTSYPIICLNSLKRRAIISSHMKKILKIAAALSMAVICMPVMKIKAAPDYSDSNYWDSTCTSDNIKDVNTFNACKSYTEYIASKTPDLQAKLDEINSEKAQVQGNIEKYGQQIADLQKDADSASAKVKEIAVKLGKEPVEVNEAPGFVVNRILIPMINEGIQVYSEGVASVKGIDTAMKLGCNHPMGPLELGDFIGLDIVLAIMDTLYKETGDSKYRPAMLLRKMVRGGHLGVKSGIGFYKYNADRTKTPVDEL